MTRLKTLPRTRWTALFVVGLGCSGCAAQTTSPRVHVTSGSLVPAPAPGGPIANVYCVNDSDCWAVGQATGPNPQPLIESYNGTGWALSGNPNIGGAGPGSLTAVSCSRAADCWAVGGSRSAASGAHTLVAHYDGSTWSAVTGPGASGATGTLTGVSCLVDGSCWAVGDAGTPAPLIEHFNGSAWTAFPAARVPDTASVLYGVFCRDAANCWAVGSRGGRHTLVERFQGTSWTAVPSQDTGAGDTDTLAGVTCSVGGTCWAVGSRSRDGVRGTLIEGLTGGTWTTASTSIPAFTRDSALSAVACASDTDCWAVGAARFAGVSQGLSEQYSGAGWQVRQSSSLGVAHSSFASVACPENDDCWMVGSCSSVATWPCGGSTSLIELYDLILPDGH